MNSIRSVKGYWIFLATQTLSKVLNSFHLAVGEQKTQAPNDGLLFWTLPVFQIAPNVFLASYIELCMVMKSRTVVSYKEMQGKRVIF